MSTAVYSAIVLTPPGPGAIAVIQVRGPGAIGAAAGVARLKNGKTLADCPPGRIARADFIANGQRIDEGLIVVRGESLTDSVVELHCHGSTRVVQRLMTALAGDGGADNAAWQTEGAGWAERTAADQELATALLRARTRGAVAFVLSQAAALPEHLARLAAKGRHRGSAWLIERLEALRRTTRTTDLLLDGVHLALVGPANAGKSTLANRLLGRNRLVVSAEAGTTRDWSEEPAALAGVPITVIDTAGRRATDHPIEREAIARGGARAADAHLLLVVLDLSVPLPRGADRLAATYPPGVPRLWVANKCDLPAAWDWARLPEARDATRVRVSALTGEGLPALERAVLRAVGLADISAVGPCLLTGREVMTVERCVRLLRAGHVESAASLLEEWAAAGAVAADRC